MRLISIAFLLLAGAAHGAPPQAAPLSAPEAARVAEVTRAAQDFTAPEPFEARPAGAGTAMDGAFSAPLPTLPEAERFDFALGEALFEKLWVPAPSTTRASDGLGPLFNARACASCHPGDSRGAPVDEAAGLSGMVLKLGAPGGGPDPHLGAQLQDRAAPGLAPEGALALEWIEEQIPLAGGESLSLRRPVPRVTPPLGPATLTDLRIAPQLIGLGLLEAVPEAAIRAGADPEDRNGDGISGRVSELGGALGPRLGRFGQKAGAASLPEMIAAAFATDLGLSTPLFPDPAGDCTAAQTACRAAPMGEDAGLRDGREVSAEALDLTAAYIRGLAVPARRTPGAPQVLAGKAAFYDAGCPACHRPKFVTEKRPADPARSFQLIWPYTDLLLHDMGPGLAETRPEAGASGAEWRTPPLWGIGLTAAARGGPARFLHDGRARSLLEAVLWHGGEARAARDRVAAMAPETRAALIRFLESL